jgi:hypothetical protein
MIIIFVLRFLLVKRDEGLWSVIKKYRVRTFTRISYISHDFTEVYSSVESFSQESNSLRELLLGVLAGQDTKLFRFPGGSCTKRIERNG